MGILSFNWVFEIYPGYYFRPWRLLMLVYTAPGIIAAFWLLRLQESPRFLLMKGMHDKAVAVMQWIRKTNGKANIEMITKLTCEGSEVQDNNKITNSKDS